MKKKSFLAYCGLNFAHTDDGVEYCWHAITGTVRVKEWRNFEMVIEKAMLACKMPDKSRKTILLTSTKWWTLAQEARKK